MKMPSKAFNPLCSIGVGATRYGGEPLWVRKCRKILRRIRIRDFHGMKMLKKCALNLVRIVIRQFLRSKSYNYFNLPRRVIDIHIKGTGSKQKSVGSRLGNKYKYIAQSKWN